MKAVFINHCHPQMPHVCGLRVSRFADALAARGHQIVLLTETYPPDAAGMTADRLPKALEDHDWSHPFVLACAPVGHERIHQARQGGLSALRRKAVIAGAFLCHDGMFADWQTGAAAVLPTLVREFEPDVVWASFGNTDAWAIGRDLARRAGCPWVADMKDNWSAFLPTGLVRLMAHRFRDAAHMTVLSEGHCDEADRYFHGTKTVVYSGVERILDSRLKDGSFRITFAGSIYDRARFQTLMSGVAGWLGTSDRGDVVFQYAGNDEADARRLTDHMDDLMTRRFLGYLASDDLAALQAQSNVNIYVHNDRCILHHKALELIAAGRPILCLPEESAETRRLAGDAGGSLFACVGEDDVVAALDVIAAGGLPVPSRRDLEPFTWAARAQALIHVLDAAVTAGTGRA